MPSEKTSSCGDSNLGISWWIPRGVLLDGPQTLTTCLFQHFGKIWARKMSLLVRRVMSIESKFSLTSKDRMWALASHLWFCIVREQQIGKQAFCLRLQKSQSLFNDYYSLLCNYDCMGNPAQSRELLESSDSNLRPCGFVWMLKYLVCGLLACSIACLMDPFPTCTMFPLLDGTLWNEYWDCGKDKAKRVYVGKGRLDP